jgi:putative transposase
MAALCRHFGVSRDCGYLWWRRFVAEGTRGLVERSSVPHGARAMRERWWSRLRRLRQAQPLAGPEKLHWTLQRQYPSGPWPSARTIGRWLSGVGLCGLRVRRARRGPEVLVPPFTVAASANRVWTIDFKGTFATGDGTKITALTVRDLATRYVLLVRQVPHSTAEGVRPVLQRLFRRCGLPEVIRVDNGPPFGGQGARGWTVLSAWWIQLGIQVEYSRPACPQDNAAHEQMHRVLKAATARPPAWCARAQQRRFDRWRHHYNHARPHAALGQRVPAELYCKSSRRLPPRLAPWTYPKFWSRVLVNANGHTNWHRRKRWLGRAFVGHCLGFKPVGQDHHQVFFGPHLIGTLHDRDHGGLRPVQTRRLPPKPNAGGGCAPSLHPPQI